MSLAGFEPTTTAVERPQTHVADHAATGGPAIIITIIIIIIIIIIIDGLTVLRFANENKGPLHQEKLPTLLSNTQSYPYRHQTVNDG